MMKIAIEGCAHGELDTIYETILYIQNRDNIKIDLLICCGDFQCSRNENDLRCMAVPPKYYNMCSFYKYYSGEKIAPVLTIFVGGNHEASNYLQELPYGGWVAPNIYYMGYAGVVNFGGLRIAGLSGIYKERDYMKGRFEAPPYDENTKRSVYHIRNLDVFRLKQMKQPIDIFLSHDWPTDICNYGNKDQLVRFKPHFKEDIENGQLGSKPCKQLLSELQPSYWFAAHLHCKFSALVPHDKDKLTRFLALDKCLPNRRYMQILNIAHDPAADMELRYDLEWLTILKMTNHFVSIKTMLNYLPNTLDDERSKSLEEEKTMILTRLDNNLIIPKNFQPTAPSYNPNKSNNTHKIEQPRPVANSQTIKFCEILRIDDPLSLIKNLDEPQEFKTFNDSLSDSFNNTSFISDTDLEGSPNFMGGTPRKRTSLNLPAPINLIESFGAEESIDKMNLTDSRCADSPSIFHNDNGKELQEEHISKEKIDNLSDSVCIELHNIDGEKELQEKQVVEDKMNDSSSSAVKKFKRRNAALYQFCT